MRERESLSVGVAVSQTRKGHSLVARGVGIQAVCDAPSNSLRETNDAERFTTRQMKGKTLFLSLAVSPSAPVPQPPWLPATGCDWCATSPSFALLPSLACCDTRDHRLLSAICQSVCLSLSLVTLLPAFSRPSPLGLSASPSASPVSPPLVAAFRVVLSFKRDLRCIHLSTRLPSSPFLLVPSI